ncbi:Zn-dependent hydrolase [Rhodoligotrophos defluvii]|uniref:Zn-dependent hydrolase n=1 Tax=Rhodoligotrophos defluvii TaxID=2561934 RepID=UPI0010CA02DA|nr:Zn-dependent hydrolase [Rhodoligotrophos defluvii]
MTRRNLRVNGERLWSRLMEMAEIGATPKGGVCRLTLSDEDKQARDLFAAWCRQAGLTVEVDAMGNMFARRKGRRPGPAVMAGSHLDSQPTGGKFDGALGVLAALEAIETMNDAGIETEYPIEIVNWTNEEGARFAPAMVSSGVYAGVFPLENAYGFTDKRGATLGGELERIGYKGSLPVGGRDWKASFEVHIEQGPILEEQDLPVGVVTSVQGIRWFDVVITGDEVHAGPTPMDRRRDPVRGLYTILAGCYAAAADHGEWMRFTVGDLKVAPGSRNTVPGMVTFTVDLRHPQDEMLDSMEQAMRDIAAEAGAQHKVDVKVERIWKSPPVAFDEGCVNSIRRAAEACGYATRDMVSGAGHDAVYVARVTPTAMIFVPSRDGISHNEAEYSSPEACKAGADVLLHALLDQAGVADQ